MSTDSGKSTKVQPALQEERYSLRDMLAEVALESQDGTFGAERLHQKDVRKIFRAKPLKRRAAQD
jgi:hypothetical protein